MRTIQILILPLALALAAQTTGAQSVITPTEKIPLWGDNDLSGWDFALKDDSADADSVWSIEDGVIEFRNACLTPLYQ